MPGETFVAFDADQPSQRERLRRTARSGVINTAAAPLTLDDYVRLVRRSELVDEESLRRYVRKLDRSVGDEAQLVGRLSISLEAAGLLTPWHNSHLLQGNWRGFHLGKYRLLSRIASGGMGCVYLAEHRLMRRRTAIKVLPRARVKKASYLQRFLNEARAIAALDHPNIIHVYSVDNRNDTYYMVLELVDGTNLQELVEHQGPLAVADAVEYTLQTARGLAHAHQRGIIHRDIKPANLLLDGSGTIKILDMGLARLGTLDESSLTLEHKERILGTADFLSPEQVTDSHRIDERADLYCLGCTLYCLLTGHPPFAKGTLTERLMAHQNDPPPPLERQRPDVPHKIIEICEKLMAKDPDDRYPSAEALIEDLAEWQRVVDFSMSDTRCQSRSDTRLRRAMQQPSARARDAVAKPPADSPRPAPSNSSAIISIADEARRRKSEYGEWLVTTILIGVAAAAILMICCGR